MKLATHRFYRQAQHKPCRGLLFGAVLVVARARAEAAELLTPLANAAITALLLDPCGSPTHASNGSL